MISCLILFDIVCWCMFWFSLDKRFQRSNKGYTCDMFGCGNCNDDQIRAGRSQVDLGPGLRKLNLSGDCSVDTICILSISHVSGKLLSSQERCGSSLCICAIHTFLGILLKNIRISDKKMIHWHHWHRILRKPLVQTSHQVVTHSTRWNLHTQLAYARRTQATRICSPSLYPFLALHLQHHMPPRHSKYSRWFKMETDGHFGWRKNIHQNTIKDH